MVAAHKVLVVDDDPIVTKSCRRILAKDGYDVDATESGQEGLRRGLGQDFDLVIADLKIPDLDGMELVRALRSRKPQTAVVIITGYGTVLSRLEAAKLGVSDYAAKPFTPERIRKAVRRALGQAKGKPADRTTHLWLGEPLMEAVAAPASFRQYAPQDGAGLLRMYLTFEPKAAYQGLPPFTEAVTRRWVSDLVGTAKNTNFVLKLGQEVIAHAALVYYPNCPLEEEIIIFVHQDYQGRGWGRRLFLATLNWACLHLKLRRVWLSVESYNARARRLYSSLGFMPVPSTTLQPEIEMIRPLQCQECLKDRCPIFSAGPSPKGFVRSCS